MSETVELRRKFFSAVLCFSDNCGTRRQSASAPGSEPPLVTCVCKRLLILELSTFSSGIFVQIRASGNSMISNYASSAVTIGCRVCVLLDSLEQPPAAASPFWVVLLLFSCPVLVAGQMIVDCRFSFMSNRLCVCMTEQEVTILIQAVTFVLPCSVLHSLLGKVWHCQVTGVVCFKWVHLWPVWLQHMCASFLQVTLGEFEWHCDWL